MKPIVKGNINLHRAKDISLGYCSGRNLTMGVQIPIARNWLMVVFENGPHLVYVDKNGNADFESGKGHRVWAF